MRNLYEIVLVTIYVLTYNHANGDDAEDRRPKYLQDKAANCEVGTIIKKDDDVCNWCKCEAKGVLVCTLIGCEAKRNVDQKDYPGLNALDGEVYDEIETFDKIRGRNCYLICWSSSLSLFQPFLFFIIMSSTT